MRSTPLPHVVGKCIEEWHGIPQGRPLDNEEVFYLSDLAMLYLLERIPGLIPRDKLLPFTNPPLPSSGQHQPKHMPIDTDRIVLKLRSAGIDSDNQALLITNFSGTAQEQDLTETPNCNGLGRIRHFRRHGSAGWPENPLPIDPACKALGLPRTDILRAQVFQNAVCSWRCWYCFVPFELLKANKEHAEWLRAERLIDLYVTQEQRPRVLDLTGGQPDLVPEWVIWMIDELQRRGLADDVFLWSDDNLSNDYFWRFLSKEQRNTIKYFRNYGRVGCFKGFDERSFAFNTGAYPDLFNRQFQAAQRFIDFGIDLYCYVTLTSAVQIGIGEKIKRFVDRLQEIHENIPLRTVPLEIRLFSPVVARLTETYKQALRNQWLAVEAWQKELDTRFTSADRALNIAEVSFGKRTVNS